MAEDTPRYLVRTTLDAGSKAPNCRCGCAAIRMLHGFVPLEMAGRTLDEAPAPSEPCSFKASGICPCGAAHHYKITLTPDGPVVEPQPRERTRSNRLQR